MAKGFDVARHPAVASSHAHISGNTYRLLRKGAGPEDRRETEFEAGGLSEAVEIAVRQFGVGELELHVLGGKSYLLRTHPDRSWLLQPLYQL